MRNPNKRIQNPILNLLYPPFCVSCETLLPYRVKGNGVMLCPSCAQKWENEKRTFCPICGKAHMDCGCGVPGLSDRVSEFLHLARYTDWESVARNVVLCAKDHAYGSLYGFMVSELTDLLDRRKVDTEGAVIVYIPRNPAKVRDVGVDQGRKTAKMLARQLGIRCVNILARNRAVQQKSLTASQRRENAKKAFSLRKRRISQIEGRPVILYDDVITSGASVSRAVELLESAGVGKITVLTFAKTVMEPKNRRSGENNGETDIYDEDFSDFSPDDDG